MWSPVLAVTVSPAITLALPVGLWQTLKQSRLDKYLTTQLGFLTGLFLWGGPPPSPLLLLAIDFQISALEAGFSRGPYMVHSNYRQKFRDLKFAQKFFQILKLFIRKKGVSHETNERRA